MTGFHIRESVQWETLTFIGKRTSSPYWAYALEVLFPVVVYINIYFVLYDFVMLIIFYFDKNISYI